MASISLTAKVFIYFVQSKIIPSLSGPPLISVPPLRAVTDKFLGVEPPGIVLEFMNSTMFFMSWASLGKMTACGITLNKLVSVEYLLSVSSSVNTSPLTNFFNSFANTIIFKKHLTISRIRPKLHAKEENLNKFPHRDNMFN